MLDTILRALTAIFAAVAGMAGLNLARVANKFLVEQYKTTALIGVVTFSAAFLVVAVMVFRDARFSKPAALIVVAGTSTFLIVGLGRMGNFSLSEAFLQASCSPVSTFVLTMSPPCCASRLAFASLLSLVMSSSVCAHSTNGA